MVEIGEIAPDFDAPTNDGRTLKLSSLRGGPVILYFYPQADTPGCTIESKGFRDIHPELAGRGVRVVGVSTDPVEAQEKFAGKYALPFPLVADFARSVAGAYGVLRENGRARRVTFLIGPDGRVLEIIDSSKADEHVERARARYLAGA